MDRYTPKVLFCMDGSLRFSARFSRQLRGQPRGWSVKKRQKASTSTVLHYGCLIASIQGLCGFEGSAIRSCGVDIKLLVCGAQRNWGQRVKHGEEIGSSGPQNLGGGIGDSA